MKKSDQNTEQQILTAAKSIFQKKGFDGARMQEIADEAGINKSLLHYYYRSKDKLFEAVFFDAFIKFIPRISVIMMSDEPLFKKIESFVDTYITILSENPYLPGFVINEINRNPDKIVSFIQNTGVKPEMLSVQINKEIKEGIIHPVDPRHLIVSMLGMCIFPFVGRPIIQGFLFDNNTKAYDKFLTERKTEIAKFIINSIRKK